MLVKKVIEQIKFGDQLPIIKDAFVTVQQQWKVFILSTVSTWSGLIIYTIIKKIYKKKIETI